MDLKTSRTHPIQIATLSCGEGLNSIGITLCPGKKGPSSFGGSWDRDLDVDLATIQGIFNPKVIITLMTREELVLSKVSNIGQKVEELGIRWLHLPIADMGTPSCDFEDGWRSARGYVLDALEQEGNVLIHCRGGLGRSGVLAAMLLTEIGMRNETALWAVRQGRPGAIETKEQEDFVLKYRPSSLLIPDLHWWPKCLYCVSKAVESAIDHITDPESHREAIQEWERRGVRTHEILRMIDETVTDFEHYLEDIGRQLDMIIATLGITRQPFPTNIESWLGWIWNYEGDRDFSGKEGSEWCRALEEPLNRAVQQIKLLEESDRIKIRKSYRKILRYLTEWISRTETRESHEWWNSVATSSFEIQEYLKVLIGKNAYFKAQ